MRVYLESKGVEFRFGCRVEDLDISGGAVKGLTYSRLGKDGKATGGIETLIAERVVMAAGHTAREVIHNLCHYLKYFFFSSLLLSIAVSCLRVCFSQLYESLGNREEGLAALEAKGFAVGFRVEHPQDLINSLRLGEEFSALAQGGKGKVCTLQRLLRPGQHLRLLCTKAYAIASYSLSMITI